MSEPIDDGCSKPIETPNGILWEEHSPGISLRDWLAGQALAGLVADDMRAAGPYLDCAKLAYLYADAMITARKAKV